MENTQVANVYYKAEDGGWYITDEAKAEADAMYYSGRLAYDSKDSRHPIGVYDSTGKVVKFGSQE